MYSRPHVQRKAAEASSDSSVMQPRPFSDETQPQTQSPTPDPLSTTGFDLSQIAIFSSQSTAVQTKQAVGSLIQRNPDDSVTGTGAAPSTYQVGWTDAASGAKSSVTQAPQNKGWNEDTSKVGKVLRIPIQGLKQGNQDASMNNRPEKKESKTDPGKIEIEITPVASQESAAGRAVVLIPENLVQQINTAQPIEVLLHFHGHNIRGATMTDYRQQKTDGTVYDVEVAKIEQQLEASNRPMIAVLPEGTSTSKFGKFNSDAYLKEVYDALVQTKVLTQHPNVQRVALSGHSGGGDAAGRLLNTKNAPTQMADLILFDGIHGDGKAATGWVKSRLEQDFAYLTSGISEADQLHYLETSSRFRGYYTNGYARRYESLEKAIATWFGQHADQLGGSSSAVYKKLKDNYQTIPVGHKDHFRVMSEINNAAAGNDQTHQTPLLDALNALPSNALPPSTGTPAPASTQAPVPSTMVPSATAQSAVQSVSPQSPESASKNGATPAVGQSDLLNVGLQAIAHLLVQSPQLALNALMQFLSGKSKTIQTVTDRKALIRTSPPELESTGQVIPQGSQVEILRTETQNERDFALVQQVMPDGIAGPPMLWGWTLKSNLSGAKAEKKEVPAGENSHTEQPSANQPVPTPTDFKKVKFGRSLPQVDGVLEKAGKKPEEWFSNFTSITFLGQPLKAPIHISLAEHLKAVEAKFAAKYGSAEAAGKQLGLTEPIVGSREKSKTAEYSMHIFGLAIDLDPSKNPYIANGKKTMESTNKVFHRIGMLLNDQPLEFKKVYGTEKSDIEKAFAQNEAIDTALEKYFSYSQASERIEELEKQLKKNKDQKLEEKLQKAIEEKNIKDQELKKLLDKTNASEWKGKSLEEARAIIKKDIEICAALWARGGKEDQVGEHGMMSLKEELVTGMGLDWGGRYGDFMHFDMRNHGVGQEIYDAIGKYKKQLEKEKKEGK